MSEGGSCWLLTGASDARDDALGARHQVCLLTFCPPSKHHVKLKSSRAAESWLTKTGCKPHVAKA